MSKKWIKKEKIQKAEKPFFQKIQIFEENFKKLRQKWKIIIYNWN